MNKCELIKLLNSYQNRNEKLLNKLYIGLIIKL